MLFSLLLWDCRSEDAENPLAFDMMIAKKVSEVG